MSGGGGRGRGVGGGVILAGLRVMQVFRAARAAQTGAGGRPGSVTYIFS